MNSIESQNIKICGLYETSEGEKEESLWAERTGLGYKLLNTPWHIKGLALGDIVYCAERVEAPPLFLRVIKQSGRKSLRVFVPKSDDRNFIKNAIFNYLDKVSDCFYEGLGNNSGLISISVAFESIEGIVDYLEDLEKNGVAHWESMNF